MRYGSRATMNVLTTIFSRLHWTASSRVLLTMRGSSPKEFLYNLPASSKMAEGFPSVTMKICLLTEPHLRNRLRAS